MNDTSEQNCSETPLIRLERGRKWNILTSVYVGLGVLTLFHAGIIYPFTLFQLLAYGGSSLVIAGFMFQVSYPCTYRRYAPFISLVTCLVLLMVSPIFGTVPFLPSSNMISVLMFLLDIVAACLSLFLIIRR